MNYQAPEFIHGSVLEDKFCLRALIFDGPQQRPRGGRFDITKLGPMLDDAPTRLAAVNIERLPFADFIERYDRPTTLFDVDPPYCGSEGDDGKELFKREDFEALSARLKALRGTFIMSINDVPEIRDLFSWVTIERVETSHTVARKTPSTRASELIPEPIDLNPWPILRDAARGGSSGQAGRLDGSCDESATARFGIILSPR